MTGSEPPQIIAAETLSTGIRLLIQAADGEKRICEMSAGELWAMGSSKPRTWDGKEKP